MANIFNKTKTPIAITSFSEQDLSCQHVTTSNFMNISVANALELVPKQSIDISHSLFSRLEAMPVPTFGNANIHNKAFFVPFRTIFRGWNDFIEDTPHTYPDGSYNIPITVPYITNDKFLDFLTSSSCAEAIDPDAEQFDFRIVTTNGTLPTYGAYNFTTFGRLCYKILIQLGYRINFNRLTTHDGFHSLLPLFALCKIYIDWYYPTVYAGTDRYQSIAKWLNKDVDDDDHTWWDDNFSAQDLEDIFLVITDVYYDNDYFTSVFDNPAGPNADLSSGFIVRDVTLPEDDVAVYSHADNSGTPYIDVDYNIGSGRLSQFALTALRSLTDYMKRHQIVGSRVLERYLARFGITLSAEKLNRSIYVGSFNQAIQFGDVTATSDTVQEVSGEMVGSPLGSYAGKGVSYGNGNYSFTADEYGMFIIITTIVPKVSYYQGRNRITRHLSQLDFWTPEFDNLGVQAMNVNEVYVPMDATLEYPSGNVPISLNGARINYDQKIFGFVPRYAEYKVGKDLISGDYVLGSKNVGKDSWTLFRDLSSAFFHQGMDTKHDLNFISSLDSKQYNRIFYNMSHEVDHFNIVHNFSIKSRFPGKPLFDNYEFESEEYGAKTVTTDVGGAKAN